MGAGLIKTFLSPFGDPKETDLHFILGLEL